jgi:insulysin
MMEFFKQYIHPASPERAKLAIHLHASEAPTPIVKLPIEATETVGNGLDAATNANTAKVTALEPCVIKDVREFKSRLKLSTGPRPVTDLCKFEELD